ncbi:putative ribonuclease H-like domain-containing protein [Tanacetum coccineum]
MPSKEDEKIATRRIGTKKENPTFDNIWKLYTDGASSSDKSGAGLMLLGINFHNYFVLPEKLNIAEDLRLPEEDCMKIKTNNQYTLDLFLSDKMEAGTTTTNLTVRLPILNPADYDLWLMRIEQYFLMTDYFLREVIKNGNKVLKRTVGTVEQDYEPTTIEEKQERRNEMKARATLLMALPNKDQLKFHSYQDVKLLMEAIEKRYGGNKESKKVQRTLLKQQYENFTGLSSETMDQTFDRLQKLITQLEIQGEVITQEDMNLKLLRSLPSEWKTHALIWRNKQEIETISLDDLYNNLKIYEPEISGSSSTSQNPQNVAFVSSNSTNSNSSTNEADNTAYGVSAAHTQSNPTSGDNLSDAVICAFLASQPNSPQLSQEDLEQINPDDLEEMDLQWEMAMLTIRARRFIKRTGRKLDVNENVELLGNQESSGREINRRNCGSETPMKMLVVKLEIGGYDWSYQAEEEHPTNFALMAFTSSGSSSSSDSEFSCSIKLCEFLLRLEPKTVRKNSFRPPVIEDWNSNDENEGNPQQKEYKEKGVIDSDGKGRISRKGKIKTGTLDFDNVYFCKELKYNLFSVSQICDKKNNVLFTDTECLVLSSDFKLLDESQVLLRVPRKDNIYSVDLKSVVPTKGLTCLFAKAMMNPIYGIGGLKGKQHKASCKAKLMNSISKPLHMLHMDLFGPTNVKSLMKKSYCLVVTDDFSRFSWVFFLATKDETSRILKTFITEIENQLDHKVKVIRCDNGTEFKNSVMNQFCEMKGIKREFSVARTPQQNGVAERRNRTLIEAARTMLVDSKLPTTFWAEAVNTACYVLNRVLVIKPHNKTPYELIRGRPPLIDFMKPFGCPVTILNTRDHLGKFDGKADEGFFVGYSVVSKAIRVFNKRTRIVEETLNIRFLKINTNVTGNGLDCLFDVDSLTISMNYVPVIAGNQTNGIAGTRDNTVTGQKPIEMDKSGASDKDGKDDFEMDKNGASDKDGKDD